MEKIIILGTGGFSREVFSFIRLLGEHTVSGFIDPSPSLKGKKINGIPVLGGDNELKKLFKIGVKYASVAIGNNKTREILFKKICALGFEPINIIHPSAVIASDVKIGKGVIIYPNVTVNTGVSIGNSALINSNVSIGHDTEIGDFVNISPGSNVAGRVKICKLAFLGIGCSILENIEIGKKAIVGGSALVRRNVEDNTTVVGVPAKIIRRQVNFKR